MAKLADRAALEEFRKKIQSKRRKGKVKLISLCAGSGCGAYGTAKVHHALVDELKRQKLEKKVEVKLTGCHGFCAKAPVIAIEPMGVQYQEVESDDAAEIVAKSLKQRQLIDRLTYHEPKTQQPIFYRNQIPFYAKQERRVLANCGRIDPTRIDGVVDTDGILVINPAGLSVRTTEISISTLKSRF